VTLRSTSDKPSPVGRLEGENRMSDYEGVRETLVEMSVTYSIEINGRFIIIEDVPARVNVETGERFFSPETVECLQQAVWEGCQPVRTIETPVYDYAALT
jgi:hypothetical protein